MQFQTYSRSLLGFFEEAPCNGSYEANRRRQGSRSRHPCSNAPPPAVLPAELGRSRRNRPDAGGNASETPPAPSTTLAKVGFRYGERLLRRPKRPGDELHSARMQGPSVAILRFHSRSAETGAGSAVLRCAQSSRRGRASTAPSLRGPRHHPVFVATPGPEDFSPARSRNEPRAAPAGAVTRRARRCGLPCCGPATRRRRTGKTGDHALTRGRDGFTALVGNQARTVPTA